MHDLIFVSLENWDEIWRRNQFLCAAWAQRFPESKILFVGRPQLLPHHLRHGTLSSLIRHKIGRVAHFPNITTTFIPKPLPNPAPGGRAFNEKCARFHISYVVKKLGLKNPLLWINPNDSGHLIGHFNEHGVIYDITDDWELAANNEQQKNRIHTLDRDLCRRADLTVVCSEALYQSRKEVARHLLLLPNGVDAQHYLQVDKEPPTMPWARPVFGYTGSLHRDRIDFDLVIDLAKAFPNGTVALVGPAYWTTKLDDHIRVALNKQKNIILTGPVPYQRVPHMMANFDVCIVPHLESPFVESLNPIKLWEYLACGKPIVSTNVAGFRSYPQFCKIASGASSFIHNCHEGLKEVASSNSKLKQDRRDEALINSWESRLDDLLATLRRLNLA